MELALFVYLAGVVGNIGAFLTVTSIVLFLAVLFSVIHYSLDEKLSKLSKWYIVAPFIFGLLSAMVPSEKTMYLMLAGYTTQQVVQSETAEKVVKIVNTKLDEYIIEMYKKKK